MRIKPYLLRYVPDHFKTEEMCKKAVEQASWQLENVPDQFKTQKMCEKAVEDEPHSLIFVRDHLCIEVLEKYSILLLWVPDHF